MSASLEAGDQVVINNLPPTQAEYNGNSGSVVWGIAAASLVLDGKVCAARSARQTQKRAKRAGVCRGTVLLRGDGMRNAAQVWVKLPDSVREEPLLCALENVRTIHSALTTKPGKLASKLGGSGVQNGCRHV